MAQFIFWNSFNHTYCVHRPPGPHQLASWLRLHGYTVKVIDFCHALTTTQLVELTRMHLGHETIGIGVSTTFWKLAQENVLLLDKLDKVSDCFEPSWVIDARDKLQSMFPNIRWVLGGANSTYAYGKNAKYDWEVLHGHAEDSLVKLLDDATSKKIIRPSFDIASQQSAYTIDCGITPQEVLSIELARGCQFKCKFCRYPLLGKKKNSYLRDIELVKEELIKNYELFGVTRYSIIDDTVNESEEKILALAELVPTLPFKFEWVGYNRLDLIGSRPQTMELLKLSGLKSTFFGIESFHPAASKMVGKGWNGVRGKEFLLELKEKWGSDVTMALGFIAGLVPETIEEVESTHNWCIDNKIASWSFAALIIDRTDNLVWKSIFDKEYTKYGYTFSDPLSATNWENGVWTKQIAARVANKLTIDAAKYSTLAGFFPAILGGLGYTFDELIGISKKSAPWTEFEKRGKDFFARYVHTQMNMK